MNTRIKRTITAIVLAAAMAATAPPAARACSICRCGDPAFNALGLNIYGADTWRVAIDWGRFDKTQGSAEGEEGDSESAVENRFTATISYSPSEALTLVGQVPYSRRTLTASDGSVAGRGLADPELLALLRVWNAPFEAGIGRRAWIGVQLGVKTAWGQNDAREGGVRLDEHVQPGTGSTDWIAGASGVYVVDIASSLFASLQYRQTGANDYGYRYGRIGLANAGYEHRLGSTLDGVFELNFRHAGEDRIDGDGALDPNTGGSLLYATPKLVVNLSSSLVARLAAQVPVVKHLNGAQTERTVWTAGLTWIL